MTDDDNNKDALKLTQEQEQAVVPETTTPETATLEEDEHIPYVSPDVPTNEITPRAVILGIILSIILGATNVYAGLLAGTTTSASIPAAIISMFILSTCCRHATILENNLVQTAASAGESLAAGIIFTLPALYMFDKDPAQTSEGWGTYLSGENYLTAFGLSWMGGVVGVLFSIPIRRALIVDKGLINPPLTFPEGIATANVLIKGHQRGGDRRGMASLGAGALVGTAFSIINEGLGLISTQIAFGGVVANKAPILIEIGMSPILMGIGFIVGWKVGLVMWMGSLFQFLFAIPISAALDPVSDVEGLGFSDAAYATWSGSTRNMGVGAMLFGSLYVLFDIRKSLFTGVAVGFRALVKREGAHEVRRTALGNVVRLEDEVQMKQVILAVAGCMAVIYVVIALFLNDFLDAIPLALIVLVVGFLFSAVAGFNAGLVGSSNNPVSGVTISTVLVVSGVVRGLLGGSNRLGAPISVLVGTIVCCAAAISGDQLQDLKAGYILGASPRKMVFMQLVGVTAAAFIMSPVLEVLANSYGFGGDDGLPSPQATVMKTISEGVIHSTLEPKYLLLGGLTAVVIIVIDNILRARKANFRVPVMAFAIGMYLPASLGSGVFIGSLVGLLALKDSENGLLHASGIITGYGLTGLLIAAAVVINSLTNPDPDAAKENPLAVDVNIGEAAAVVLSLLQMIVLWASLFFFGRWPEKTRGGDAEEKAVIEEREVDEAGGNGGDEVKEVPVAAAEEEEVKEVETAEQKEVAMEVAAEAEDVPPVVATEVQGDEAEKVKDTL